MTKRERMMRLWLRSEQRRVQFDQHQHRYHYRCSQVSYDVTDFLKKYDENGLLRKEYEVC